LLPPATLRPLAFRTFTKKHNLTLTSAALQALATFIGKHCGSGWREEGLAEKVLEEVAKSWKKCGGQVIVEGDKDVFKGILRTLEGAMEGGRVSQGSTLGRQSSFNFGAEQALPSRPALDATGSFGMSRGRGQGRGRGAAQGSARVGEGHWSVRAAKAGVQRVAEAL
jgi:DNA polymerase epsilon subunit 2